MSALPTQTPAVSDDPDLLPTRRAEATQAFDLLSPGHAVVIVGHPGEGRSTVTREAFRLLDRPVPSPLRCHRRTTAAQILAWFEESLPSGLGLLEDVEALPHELADLLEDLLQDQRMTILLTADAVAMRSEPGYDSVSTVGVLNDLWRRRFLGRIDLSRLPTEEIRTRIRSILPPATLDALQETALVHTASGSLALARDLTEDVLASPEDAPRLLPRAWGSGYRLSSRTLHRVAARFRDQPTDVRDAAVLVYQVGPLGYTTAARLLGPDLVNRMEASGVAHASGADDEALLVVTSVVASGLLSDPRAGSLHEPRERLLESLLRLWHTGVPLGDSTALVLARWLLDAGRQDDPRLAQLFLQAAAKSARHGWSSEAEAFCELASRHGLTQAVRPILWHTLMLDGCHEEVLAQAEALLAAHPESFDSAHLYRAAIAASWLPETPRWLQCLLDEHVTPNDPALALVTRLILGDAEPTPELLERLEANAFDANTSLPARLWSLGLCITRHVSSGNLEALVRCIATGRGLRGSVRSTQASASALERDARLMFDVACSAAQVTAGLDSTGVERVAIDRTFDAIAIGPASGRFAAANACYLHAVLAYHRGDTAAARLNIASAMHLLDRTSYSSTNAYMAVFSLELMADNATGAVDPEVLGEHLALTHTSHPRMSSSIRALMETIGSASAPEGPTHRPGWAVLSRAHHGVLSGRVEAEAALASLTDAEVALPFPSSRATVKHLRALADHDAEGLVAAAEELRDVGKLGAARHALSQARLYFLAHRQTARANDCAERLNELPLPENPKASTSPAAIPAGLTQREYEICQLVAEGLTNALIGERLFLSVRTVESHVLQARAKLRAPRRKDIPERLARITQGRP